MRGPGALLIVIGLALAAAGVLVHLGLFSWFGRLPGDIRVEGESTRIYVPIVSMLLVSLVLSAVAWVVRRLFG